MLPAVLLLSVGLALGGLALLPQRRPAAVAVTAAAASASTVVEERRVLASNSRGLGLVDREPVAPRPAAARASRSRRAAAVLPPQPQFFRPSTGRLTSPFTWRWGRMHNGIDLAGPYGLPIRSVAAGEVIGAGYEGGYGYIVRVRLDDGTQTFYAHNSVLTVTAGQRVTAGQIIAREGNSGRSTGPHVHFEVRINGLPVNPIPWLAKRGVLI